MFRRDVFFLLGLLTFLLIPQTALAAGNRVDSVKTEIVSDVSMPAIVKERMEKSVTIIGEQLMLGKNVDELLATQTAQENIILTVFDKVLVGYTVRSVTVEPGIETLIKVNLMPWSDVIAKTDVEVTIEGMPAEVEPLARQDIAGIEDVFSSSLVGLPVAAADWTNGVLKRSVEAFMEIHLPVVSGGF